jgi:predicted metal-dependent peptidase
MDQLDRIKDARVWLSARVPFLGYLSLRLRPRLANPQDGVPTAGVAPDGTLVVNPEFVATLTDPQVRGLLAHEILHPALEFWLRKGTRDQFGFNIAHDYAINLIIKDFAAQVGAGLELPPKGLIDEKYRDMTAEEIYSKLPRKRPKGGHSGDGGSSGGRGSEFGDDKDGHGDCRGDLAETEQGRDAARGDGAAQRELEKTWRIAVEAAAQSHEQQSRGSLPGSIQKIVDDIRDPKVSWQVVLGQWIGENAGKDDPTYMRPSRRSESAGAILAGVRKSGLPDVTILWDTSGSMNGTAAEILSEVSSIVDELGLSIRLISCDCAIHADVEGIDTTEKVIPNVKGGGGSDFNPAFDRLRTEGNTSVVVAFTDGYIGVPSMQPETLKGVLWVVTQHGVRPAPWGQAIKLDKDGYAEDV